jgi:hypothetical protein
MQTKLIWTQVWSLKQYVTATLRSTFAAAVAAAHGPIGVLLISVISCFKKGWYLT